jgi:hypothetical protein
LTGWCDTIRAYVECGAHAERLTGRAAGPDQHNQETDANATDTADHCGANPISSSIHEHSLLELLDPVVIDDECFGNFQPAR